MYELYTWGTPNGRKVSILLEELGAGYNAHPVDISKDEQFAPDFLRIAPNNKIPALVDPDGPGGKPLSLFESGAIMLYLADKHQRFIGDGDAAARAVVQQWLMWQMGGFGPMLGQAHHFLRFAKEDVPYAKNRFSTEAARLYGVLDAQLGAREFVAPSGYSIADMAIYPWAARHEWQQVDLDDYKNVRRWFDAMGARPAVKKGMEVPFLN